MRAVQPVALLIYIDQLVSDPTTVATYMTVKDYFDMTHLGQITNH
jgi:hypothetical protein